VRRARALAARARGEDVAAEIAALAAQARAAGLELYLQRLAVA
jgi:hypothetical protein